MYIFAIDIWYRTDGNRRHVRSASKQRCLQCQTRVINYSNRKRWLKLLQLLPVTVSLLDRAKLLVLYFDAGIKLLTCDFYQPPLQFVIGWSAKHGVKLRSNILLTLVLNNTTVVCEAVCIFIETMLKKKTHNRIVT